MNKTDFQPIEPKLAYLLSLLAGVTETSTGKWTAFCPSHPDKRSRSLGIKLGNNGGIVLHCFAGCSVEAILAAIGLTFSDLFPDRLEPKYHGVDGYDRHKARRDMPRFSRYELFPKLVLEACILHTAIGDVLAGNALSDNDLARVNQAMETIWALRAEVDR